MGYMTELEDRPETKKWFWTIPQILLFESNLITQNIRCSLPFSVGWGFFPSRSLSRFISLTIYLFP